jgi:hypothetical protein
MQVAGLQAATAYDVYLLPAAASASRRRRLHALGSDAAFASAYATRVQVTTGAATAPTAVVSSDTGAMVSANPFNVTISWDREVCAQPRRERERCAQPRRERERCAQPRRERERCGQCERELRWGCWWGGGTPSGACEPEYPLERIAGLLQRGDTRDDRHGQRGELENQARGSDGNRPEES